MTLEHQKKSDEAKDNSGRLVQFSLHFNKTFTLCAQYGCQVVARLVTKYCHSNKMTSVATIR